MQCRKVEEKVDPNLQILADKLCGSVRVKCGYFDVTMLYRRNSMERSPDINGINKLIETIGFGIGMKQMHLCKETKYDAFSITFDLSGSQWSKWKASEMAALHVLFYKAKDFLIQIKIQETDLVDCDLEKIKALCAVLKRYKVRELEVVSREESPQLSAKKRMLAVHLVSDAEKVAFLLGSSASLARTSRIYTSFFKCPELGQKAASELTKMIFEYVSPVKWGSKR